MMHNKIWIAALAAVALTGCTQEAREKYDAAGDTAAAAANQTAEAAKTDAAKTGQAVENAGEAAANTAKNAGEAVANTAENAGEAAANTAKNAGKAIDNATDAAGTTLRVKNAILSANLDAKDLNVDTMAAEKKVVLRGDVPTADARSRAEQLAKGVVGKEFTVVNQLTVAGAAPKM